jgi:cell pole-organizing protein PopZ
MTQPAKVQEPSMEEILASIRRIIADDEAKPPVAEKPSSPAAQAKPEQPTAAAPAVKAPVMNDIPPSTIPAAKAAAAKVAAAPRIAPAPPSPPPPPKPMPAPAPAAATNSQDDIDAMLAGLDEVTSEAEIRPPQPDGEVFELTDEMAVPDASQASFQKIEPHNDIEFTEPAAAKAMHRQPESERLSFESPPVRPSQEILSHSTVSAVESAFNSLANTVLSNNARTLEDLVKEMLRPMLKSWLDDNLPGLVERIVKVEIERVSRGR